MLVQTNNHPCDADSISTTLQTAFDFGQTYWMHADRYNKSSHMKAEETLARFRAFRDEIIERFKEHANEKRG